MFNNELNITYIVFFIVLPFLLSTSFAKPIEKEKAAKAAKTLLFVR